MQADLSDSRSGPLQLNFVSIDQVGLPISDKCGSKFLPSDPKYSLQRQLPLGWADLHFQGLPLAWGRHSYPRAGYCARHQLQRSVGGHSQCLHHSERTDKNLEKRKAPQSRFILPLGKPILFILMN